MTGLKKNSTERQKNETEVIDIVNAYLPDNKLTGERWFIGSVDLINLLTHSNNVDYRSLPADMAQNTLREIAGNWLKYFSETHVEQNKPSGDTEFAFTEKLSRKPPPFRVWG